MLLPGVPLLLVGLGGGSQERCPHSAGVHWGVACSGDGGQEMSLQWRARWCVVGVASPPSGILGVVQFPVADGIAAYCTDQSSCVMEPLLNVITLSFLIVVLLLFCIAVVKSWYQGVGAVLRWFVQCCW